MGRRKLQWTYNAAKAGGVDKIIPHGAVGRGEYLVQSKDTLSPGMGRGTTVTRPIGPKKEQLVRSWCR